MLVVGVANQLLCRAFFLTLKVSTQQWFMSLPPGLIFSFEDLAERFITHFAGSMKAKKYFTHLSTVKPG